MESSIVRSKEFPLKDNWKKFTPTLSQVKSLMKNDHLKRRAYVKVQSKNKKLMVNIFPINLAKAKNHPVWYNYAWFFSDTTRHDIQFPKKFFL